jgi:hypothetical protein
MMLTLQLLLSIALGADVTPTERSVPVRVHSADAEGAFHPIAPGGSLSFPTPGPGKWRVEVRQRLSQSTQRANGSVAVLGNGKHLIMTIELKGPADSAAKTDDAQGGPISEAERAAITVPAAGAFTVLRAAATGGSLLVRLSDQAGPSPMPPKAAPVVAAKAAPVVAAKPPPPAVKAAAKKPAPAARARKRRTDRLGLGAGASVGLGLPARGSKPVGYLSADVRYPVYKQLVSVSGTVGWYGIGVDESVTIADPFLGHTTVQSSWSTQVFPIIARGLVHSPVQAGPLTPVAGLGLGVFIAHRVEGSYSTTQAGIGPELLIGAEMPMEALGKIGAEKLSELGDIGAHLSWSEARMFLGHQGSDGMPVRETVANTRLNLTWFYTF